MCISAVAAAFGAFATLKAGSDAKKAAETQARAIRAASQQQAAQAAESARASAQQQEAEIAREQALREAAALEAEEVATPEIQTGQEALVASGETARRRKVGAQFNIRAGEDSAGSPGGIRL